MANLTLDINVTPGSKRFRVSPKASYAEVSCTSGSIADAKNGLADVIRERCRIPLTPTILTAHGYTAIGSHLGFDEVQVSVITPESAGGPVSRYGTCMVTGLTRNGTTTTLQQLMRYELASRIFCIERDIDKSASCILDDDERTEFIHDCERNNRFQAAYRQARDNGMSDTQAHEAACRAA